MKISMLVPIHKKYEYIHVHIIFSNFIFPCVYRKLPFCPKYHISTFQVWQHSLFLAISAQNLALSPKISNVGTLLLCIIANIFCKSMNYMYHCQIFKLMHKKGYYKCFPTSCILFTDDYFAPNLLIFRPIQLDIIDRIFGKFMNQHDIIDRIFGKFMNQHCAKLYTNTRTNMDTIMLSIFSDFCMKFEYFAPKV